MADRVYIAIASTSKNGDAVADDASFIYAATFASLADAFGDATHGFKDITAVGTDEEYFYDVFDSYTEAQSSNCDTVGFTVNIDNQVVVRAAPNYEHQGIVGAGVEITWSQGYVTHYRVAPYVTFKDLSFIVGGNGSIGIDVYGGKLVRCMNKSIGQYGASAIRLTANGAKAISTFAYDSAEDGIIVSDYVTNSLLANCAALNCVGVGIKNLLQYGSGTQTVRNCLALGNGTDMSEVAGSGTKVFSNNATSDSTALGTLPLINRVTANEIANQTIFNAHLKAGNTLETAGVDLVALGEVDVVDFRDIDGQPFTGFPIGIDQTGAFTVTAKITVYDAETLTTIQDVDVYVYADVGGGLPQGTEITSGTTDTNGEINTTPEFSGVQPVVNQGRKGSASPFYQEGKSKGVLTANGLIATIYMISDEG